MPTHENYGEMMTDLFEEYRDASRIVIACRLGSDTDIFTGAVKMDRFSVNGFTAPKAFANNMREISDRFVAEVTMKAKILQAGSFYDFLGAVRKSLSALMSETVIVSGSGQGACEERTREHAGSWVFQHFAFDPSLNTGSLSPDQLKCISGMVSPFAAAWVTVFREVKIRILFISDILTFMRGIERNPGREPAEGKIIVNGTASRLALLTRLFYEANGFATTNRSHLIRCCCNTFALNHTGILNPKVMRKKFHSPDLSTIEALIVELNGLIQILQDMRTQVN
jgi:hypothetical protein